MIVDTSIIIEDGEQLFEAIENFLVSKGYSDSGFGAVSI